MITANDIRNYIKIGQVFRLYQYTPFNKKGEKINNHLVAVVNIVDNFIFLHPIHLDGTLNTDLKPMTRRCDDIETLQSLLPDFNPTGDDYGDHPWTRMAPLRMNHEIVTMRTMATYHLNMELQIHSDHVKSMVIKSPLNLSKVILTVCFITLFLQLMAFAFPS